MSWLPDSGWLRALDLKTSTFAAVALGCWAVFALAELDLLYLGVLPSWLRAVFVIVAVLASTLWLSRLWDASFTRFTGWRRRRAVLAQLDRLPASEKELLAYLVANNEQIFSISRDSPVAAGLRSKGLVALGAASGYEHAWLHTIPDFVWRDLQHRWPVSEREGANKTDSPCSSSL